jgi:hypothetical protein
MELMAIGIYSQPTKIFILVVNGLGYNNAHALSFYHEFYAQNMQLINLYNIGSLVINVGQKHWKLLVW